LTESHFQRIPAYTTLKQEKNKKYEIGTSITKIETSITKIALSEIKTMLGEQKQSNRKDGRTKGYDCTTAG